MTILGRERGLIPGIVKRHTREMSAQSVVRKIPPLHFTELQIGRETRACLDSRHLRINYLPERQTRRRKIGLQRWCRQQDWVARRSPLSDPGSRRWIAVLQFHTERGGHVDPVA